MCVSGKLGKVAVNENRENRKTHEIHGDHRKIGENGAGVQENQWRGCSIGPDGNG